MIGLHMADVTGISLFTRDIYFHNKIPHMFQNLLTKCKSSKNFLPYQQVHFKSSEDFIKSLIK